MRNVVYMASLSVDGYIEANSGDPAWLVPDEELHRHFNELESSIDTHLYGRRFYELMAAYWPAAAENPSAPFYEIEYARIWKSVPKVIFSSTLDRVDWNARLFKGNAAEEVARLKKQTGKNLSIGGAALASTLTEHGLIDEYRLYVVPIILGGGKPMFQLHDRIMLSLVEVRRFASDIVLLHYRRRDGPLRGPPLNRNVIRLDLSRISMFGRRPHRPRTWKGPLKVMNSLLWRTTVKSWPRDSWTETRERLEAVFVRPDYQGQGVGTMILQALEAAAVNAGIKRLAVAATLNSVPFYTARGFSSRGASSYQHADGFSLPCVSMNKVVG